MGAETMRLMGKVEVEARPAERAGATAKAAVPPTAAEVTVWTGARAARETRPAEVILYTAHLRTGLAASHRMRH